MKKIFLYFCFTLLTIGVFFIGNKITQVNADQYPFNGLVVADALVIHNEPNYLSSSEVTQLAYGTRIKVTGISGTLYKIEYDSGTVGYASKNLILNVDSFTKTDNTSGIETYSDYCNALQKEGFLDSYCPYLYYLHGKYPKWTFKADKINKTLDQVSKSEEWKTVLQTGNKNYWLSTSPIEGSYYYIKSNVVKSFMDPRNSLNEEYIFQFLNLEKSTDVYNDTAMKNVTGSGNLSKYLNYYAQAGINEGVNPIHMLVRSSQEGMNNSTYGSVSGTYSTDRGFLTPEGYSLDGYYNFFNVGAWETTGYTTVGRGLAYGAGLLEGSDCVAYNEETKKHYYNEEKCGKLSDQRPWDTPEKAILGGSYFLADKYVKAGQNTLFYQKFNIGSVIPEDKLYTHQYMTNIYAPANESSTMYDAYAAGNLLNSEFEFLIPVYNNMGDVYQPVDKNGETRLKEIKVNNEVITGFDSDVVEYNINVITTENTINVAATAMAETTTITGVGSYTFNNDIAVVEINTVAEDGGTAKYVITVKKVLPENIVTVEDIISKMAVKVNGSTLYGISPGTNASTLINTVVNNKGTAKIYNSAGKLKASGNLATGDKIVINGTSEAYTYTIAVRGDTSGDGLIKINDLILIQSHILGTRKLTDVKFFAGDVNYDGSAKINDLILVQSKILGKGNL